MSEDTWLAKADADRDDRITVKMVDDEVKKNNLLIAMSDIREVWAGSYDFKAKTCTEDYLDGLCKEMYQIACDAFRANQ